MSSEGWLYAVFGHPIRHSLSPAIHNRAFSETGQGLQYISVDCAPHELSAKLEALRRLGGRGANVTRPLKETALALAAGTLDDWTTAAGAANTLVWQESGWYAANTDCEALYRRLKSTSSAMRSALVLGAGGAARASAAVLQRLNYHVAAAARNPAACDFADERLSWSERVAPRDWAVVVNATPLGQTGEAQEAEWPIPAAGGVAVDWVYRPNRTQFLEAAQAHGIATVDGLSLLVEQAALAWLVWFGYEGPREAMNEAVREWR